MALSVRARGAVPAWEPRGLRQTRSPPFAAIRYRAYRRRWEEKWFRRARIRWHPNISGGGQTLNLLATRVTQVRPIDGR